MDIRSMRSFTVGVSGVIATLGFLLGIAPGSAWAEGRSGAVFVLTNHSTGNSVIAYRRAPDGTLSLSGGFSTGGKGMGTGVDPLGSQGALVLGEAHRLLFAVNAGSNEISVFAVTGTDLQLLDKVSSGGTMPVSIAVHGRLALRAERGRQSQHHGILYRAAYRSPDPPGRIATKPIGRQRCKPGPSQFQPGRQRLDGNREGNPDH